LGGGGGVFNPFGSVRTNGGPRESDLMKKKEVA